MYTKLAHIERGIYVFEKGVLNQRRIVPDVHSAVVLSLSRAKDAVRVVEAAYSWLESSGHCK